MQSLQNWLGGGAPDREPAGGSVLAGWQAYSGGSGSAAAPASAGQGDRLLAAEEGTAGTAAGATSTGEDCYMMARGLEVGAYVPARRTYRRLNRPNRPPCGNLPLTATLLPSLLAAVKSLVSSAVGLVSGAANSAAAAATGATSK